MGTENVQTGGEGASGAGGEPTKAEPAKAEPAKAEPAKAGAASGQAAGAAGGQAPPKRATLAADDDEVPDGTEILELSPKALNGRIARATKKEIKAMLAELEVEDVDALKALAAEHKELKAKSEEDRRKQLSQQEKDREDLAREKSRADAAEAKAVAMEAQQEYERVDTRAERVAAKYLDEDVVEAQMVKFAKHLSTELSKKELQALTPKDFDTKLEAWCKDLVERKPKFAKDYDAKAADKKDEKRKVGATNTADDATKRPKEGSSGAAGEKNFAPGKGMSSQEARAAARAQGLQW